MIERASTLQHTQWMTSTKISAPAYTRAISETLSQMPLNNKHAFERTSAITFQISPLRTGLSALCAAMAYPSLDDDLSILSRPNYSLEGTSRELAGKVGEAVSATPLNSNR